MKVKAGQVALGLGAAGLAIAVGFLAWRWWESLPIVEYDFNEGSGGVLHDRSVKEGFQDGRIYGMKWGRVPETNKPYLYNDRWPVKDEAYVDLGVIDLGTGDLSMEAVFYIEDWDKTRVDYRYSNVLTGYHAPGKKGYLCAILYTPRRSFGVIGRCADDATWTVFLGGARDLPDRAWIHWIASRDVKRGETYGLVNGQPFRGKIKEKPNAHLCYHMFIGRQIFNGADFHGRIGWLAMWRRKLGWEEMRRRYERARRLFPLAQLGRVVAEAELPEELAQR